MFFGRPGRVQSLARSNFILQMGISSWANAPYLTECAQKKDPKQCCKSFIACKNLLRDWVFWRAELKRKSMQRSSGSSVFSAKGCNLFWKTKINMTRILDSVKATDFWQIYFSLAVRLRPEPSDFYLLLLKTLPAGKMCVCPPQTTAKFVQNHKSQWLLI